MLKARGAVRQGNQWRALIKVNGRQVLLGRFASRAEASRAYRQASRHARLLNDVAAATLGLPPLTDTCPGCGWGENLDDPPPDASASTRRPRPPTVRPRGQADRQP